MRYMRGLFSSSFRLFTVTALLAVGLCAQTNGKDVTKPMPFAAGETLTYEGKISRIISGIAIADLTFTVSQPEGSVDYLVKAEAKSKGTLLKIFRFSFKQDVESTIGGREFRVLKTVKHDVQKDRVRDSEALFDYKQERVTYTEVDPKDSMRPPRTMNPPRSRVRSPAHDEASPSPSMAE